MKTMTAGSNASANRPFCCDLGFKLLFSFLLFLLSFLSCTLCVPIYEQVKPGYSRLASLLNWPFTAFRMLVRFDSSSPVDGKIRKSTHLWC